MKIKYGIFIPVLMMVILLSCVYSYKDYINHRNSLINGIEQKLYTAALMARAALPQDYHDTIIGQSSVTRQGFEQVVSRYNELCVELEMEYLWSLMKIDGTIVFTSATSPDKVTSNQKHAQFFEPHTNPELFEGVLSSQKIHFRNIHSKWGKTKVVLVPFMDQNGRPYLFGASMKLSRVNELLKKGINESVFFGLGFLLTGFVLSYILAKLLSAPLNDLAGEAAQIASGDLDKQVSEKGFYEQTLLARSFNRVARTVREKMTALEENEEKLSTLFEAMTEMVVLHELVLNNDGIAVNYRIIDCNKAFSNITGIRKEDAVGRLATEVYQEATAPYLEEFAYVGMTGQQYEYSTYYQPIDKYFVISVVSPKKGQFATITTDVTAMRQIQDTMASKNRELENYLYVASHDLRSPLVNIQGFSQRLKKQVDAIDDALSDIPIDDRTRKEIDGVIYGGIPKTLNFIFTSVTKMDALIKGLLKISRTGRVKMNLRKIDMNLLLQKIISGQSFQLETASARVAVEELHSCYGDEELLNQLFSNLIGNAVKYRDDKRELSITISSSSAYNKVTYAVKDTGTGISERHLGKIWDVFYQIDPKSVQAGEGIGLSIVKRITDKHRGKITVESRPDEGTTFFIELNKHESSE